MTIQGGEKYNSRTKVQTAPRLLKPRNQNEYMTLREDEKVRQPPL